MKYAFAILVLPVLAANACAAQPQPAASESEVLVAAKQLSAQDCAPRGWSEQHEERMVGCSYSAAFIEGQWWVTQVYDFEYRGKRAHASGGNIYIFNRAGRFVKIVRGM